jgi:hypothetical protein
LLQPSGMEEDQSASELQRHPWRAWCPETTVEDVRAAIEREGVAVVPNVLDERERTLVENMQWEWLERIWLDDADKIRRDDPASWENYKKLGPLHGGKGACVRSHLRPPPPNRRLTYTVPVR